MKIIRQKYPDLFVTLIASLGWFLLLSPGIANGENTSKGLDISIVGPRTVKIEIEKYSGLQYVSAANGSDKNGEGTKENPWGSVQKALKEAKDVSASRRFAIMIAAGTYNQATIHLKRHVDLYGGFDPDSWQRDIFKNPTFLDGREIRRVVIGASNCRLDGFIITRGRAQGPGGGILCDGTSPEITNNRITHNATVAPAGFRTDRIHQTGHIGGGMACLYDAVPRITNNLFTHNKTDVGEGGGLAVFGWNRLPGRPRAVIKNNVFMENLSGEKDFHRTRSSSGGAISCSHEASPLIKNNVVCTNRASGRSDAGGIYSEYYSSPEIVGNWIIGNVSDDDGGGYYSMRLGDPVLINNILAGNWTTGGGVGGARVSKEGRAVLIGNRIVQNLTGGGLLSVDSRVVVKDNVIADNQKGPGFGYRQNFDYFTASPIENNFIFGNENGSLLVEANKGELPIFNDNWIEEELESGSASGNDFNQVVTDDGLIFEMISTRFNISEFTTSVTVPQSVLLDADLGGRVLRLADQWAVVRSNDENSLTVWGKLSLPEGKAAAEILPTYRIRR